MQSSPPTDSTVVLSPRLRGPRALLRFLARCKLCGVTPVPIQRRFAPQAVRPSSRPCAEALRGSLDCLIGAPRLHPNTGEALSDDPLRPPEAVVHRVAPSSRRPVATFCHPEPSRHQVRTQLVGRVPLYCGLDEHLATKAPILRPPGCKHGDPPGSYRSRPCRSLSKAPGRSRPGPVPAQGSPGPWRMVARRSEAGAIVPPRGGPPGGRSVPRRT